MEDVVKDCILHGGQVNIQYNCIVTFDHACALFDKQQLKAKFFLFLLKGEGDESQTVK
jgi:hypothetical protein